VASSTFHAFGLRIIGEATGRKPSLPDDLATDNGIGRLARIVDVLRDQDPAFRRDWDLFRLVFGRQLPDLGDEADSEKADRRTGVLGFETLAGEVVKSQEEVMIANWLFLNGVRYEYERRYAHDVADAHHSQYQPDFYYPDIDVRHEHWTLGPDGNPPPHFDGYAESMAWRRQTHARFSCQGRPGNRRHGEAGCEKRATSRSKLRRECRPFPGDSANAWRVVKWAPTMPPCRVPATPSAMKGSASSDWDCRPRAAFTARHSNRSKALQLLCR
jgi:hypothetical protein